MNRPFFTEFLDDYFAESDGHLASIKSGVLELEKSVGAGVAGKPLLDDLLRNAHSMKGLSAMVGFTEISELAHATEEFLRNLSLGVTLTEQGIEAFAASTGAMERALAARRQNGKSDVSEELALLAQLTPGGSPAPGAAPEEGVHLWKVRFSPTTELAERGINVNTVRTHLRAAGDILQAAPLVAADGRVSFEFHVQSEQMPQPLDGLTVEAASAAGQPESAVKTLFREASHAAVVAPPNVVRVDTQRLDEMMRLAGELVVNRFRLADEIDALTVSNLAHQQGKLQETLAVMERHLRGMRDAIMRARMVPIRQIFERLRFVVRNMERDSGKAVDFHISGEETEIDKMVVERLMDPLLHLVRNALSHGLESNEERAKAGKPVRGSLRLQASTSAQNVVIVIEDDGRGIDRQAVQERAQAVGLLRPGEHLDEDRLLSIISEPGFSTRDDADMSSGRGFGMSVVRETVEELGGSAKLSTETGRRTQFTVTLPITLAITDALLVASNGQRFAIPRNFIREVMRVEGDALISMENNDLIPYRGGVLPIRRLADWLQASSESRPSFHVLVVGGDSNAVGLAVDRIVDHREIVVRSISDPELKTPGITGATETGDGKPILILDPRVLTR